MKLIGGKDYYDSALRFGQDPSIVFVRHKDKRLEERLLSRSYLIDTSYRPFGSKQLQFETVQIYFCGVKYNGVKIHTTKVVDPCLGIPQNVREEHIFWDYEQVESFCSKNGFETYNTKEEFVKYFNEDKNSEYLRSKLIDLNITIAVLIKRGYLSSDDYWQIDPFTLKDFQFFKVKDAFTAFQEISMWIGGVLTKNYNPPQIVDEKIRIEKRGFDSKWSFRKEPKTHKG